MILKKMKKIYNRCLFKIFRFSIIYYLNKFQTIDQFRKFLENKYKDHPFSGAVVLWYLNFIYNIDNNLKAYYAFKKLQKLKAIF